MSLMDDPEIVEDFVKETNTLLDELESILDDLEDDMSQYSPLLEKYGQIIDRVMGAAKSIGAQEIATFCELGKIIGYKSSQVNDAPLINVVVAILFDATELLKLMVEQIRNKNDKSLKGLSTEAFASRLKWLSDKFKHIDRASVSYKEEDTSKPKSDNMDQSSIDDLIAELGL